MILAQIRQVRIEEMLDVMRDVVLPVFEGTKANLFVTCAPVMEKELAEGFKEIGFEAQVKSLDFFQDDYGFGDGEIADGEKGDDQNGDEEEEDDEGDDEDEDDEGDDEEEDEDMQDD